MAALLTQLPYCENGITLTAAEERPVPATAVDPATPGLETALIQAVADAVGTASTAARPDGGTTGPLGEGPAATEEGQRGPEHGQSGDETDGVSPGPSLGVVTPHNAQRGALETMLPGDVTTNTVEKYQGGERDIIAVSGTVSDPEFARREERFILNPRRLLVAISRSRLLTIVVCSTALFEVAPEDSAHLDDGPVWARLFTQAVGRDTDPAWAGPLGEFVSDADSTHATVPVPVYSSTVDIEKGDQ